VATVEVPVPDTGTPFSRPVVPNGLVPTDPDGDGRYEDVDGDGRLTFVDVVALFVNFERRPVEANPRALDYNRNGRLDFGDVIALFESV
jgi:PKD repeat protein